MLRIQRVLAALLATATFVGLTACGQAGINGPVDIPAGSTAEGATTINGSVTVGDGAKVGAVGTVNGGVRLGANVTAQSVRTVNGGVEIGSGTRISQDVDVVNGGVELSKGADVTGSVRNVNGGIRLDAAHVGKGLATFTGDIDVGHGSHVEGGIHVQKPDFGSEAPRTPRIVIGGGAVVEGTLKFDREVKLLVSDTAKIGPIEGAMPQMFSGDDTNHLIEAASPGAAADAPAEKPSDKPAGAAAKP
jgi:hypothetical protein